MQVFDKGRDIELVARVEGNKGNVEVVIESLTSEREEVEVQLRFFEQGSNGEWRLNLPTDALARGHYDLTIAAGGALLKDSFVLN